MGEVTAWRERVALAKVLDAPWRLTAREMRQVDRRAEGLDPAACRRKGSNARSIARERERNARPVDFDRLDPEQHTLRTLKLLLLQWFEREEIRTFSLSSLRAREHIERAASLVTLRSLHLRRAAEAPVSTDAVRATALDAPSTEICRTLQVCLAELMRDGSVVQSGRGRGGVRWETVGAWNLGEQVAAVGERGMSVRSVLAAVRAAGGGRWASVSKHSVAGLMHLLTK